MKPNFYLRHGKRIFDLVVTLPALVLLAPLFVVIALAIKMNSHGPVFYRQERIGRDGVPFRLCKFRSMEVGAETKGAGILVVSGDSRITGVGRLIRKISLDELPQLFNVVLGQMSVVGPRPGLKYQVEQYDDVQRQRLLVRPGVTGYAQVLGRNAINWERRIQLDLGYIEKASLWWDLLIIGLTLPAVLSGQDLIAPADYWKERAKSGASGQQGKRQDATPGREARDASAGGVAGGDDDPR